MELHAPTQAPGQRQKLNELDVMNASLVQPPVICGDIMASRFAETSVTWSYNLTMTKIVARRLFHETMKNATATSAGKRNELRT